MCRPHPLAENQATSYPDAALKAGCGDGIVPVRVHVGIDGRVSQMRRIPDRAVAADACYREFEAAVRQAVGTWRYVPAYRVRRPEAPGDASAVEPVPLGLDLDYEFLFTVVDGKGTVRSK